MKINHFITLLTTPFRNNESNYPPSEWKWIFQKMRAMYPAIMFFGLNCMQAKVIFKKFIAPHSCSCDSRPCFVRTSASNRAHVFEGSWIIDTITEVSIFKCLQNVHPMQADRCAAISEHYINVISNSTNPSIPRIPAPPRHLFNPPPLNLCFCVNLSPFSLYFLYFVIPD